jgi:hypothetical protein
LALKDPFGRRPRTDPERWRIEEQRQMAAAWPVEYDPELGDERFVWRQRVGELWVQFRLFVDARPATRANDGRAAWLAMVQFLDHRWRPLPTTKWDRGHVVAAERLARQLLEQVGDARRECEFSATGDETFSLFRRLAPHEEEELKATLEKLHA